MGASVLFDRWRQCVLPYLRHLAIVFAMWRTLAPLGKYDWTCASFSPLESTTKMANGSVQPFLHSLWHKVPILYNRRPYRPELPLPIGDLDLPCNTWCFGPMRAHNPNGISIGSAVFARVTADCPYAFQWFACFPVKCGIWQSHTVISC